MKHKSEHAIGTQRDSIATARRRSLPQQPPQNGIVQGNGNMAISYGTLSLSVADVHAAIPHQLTRRLYFVLLLLLLPASLLALAGTVVAMRLPPLYAARADVMIHMQQPGDAVLRYYTSQNLIIKAPALLGSIAANAQLSYENLSQQISVDFPKGSNIMRIQVENRDPERAVLLLQQILAAYETAIARVELSESATHEVVSAPTMVHGPVYPVPSQFAAIGAALGLMLSMAAFAISGRFRNRHL